MKSLFDENFRKTKTAREFSTEFEAIVQQYYKVMCEEGGYSPNEVCQIMQDAVATRRDVQMIALDVKRFKDERDVR